MPTRPARSIPARRSCPSWRYRRVVAWSENDPSDRDECRPSRLPPSSDEINKCYSPAHSPNCRILRGSTAHRFGQAGPAPWWPNNSGRETAPIVVTSHTTRVVATQDAMPRRVSPCVTAVARINAKTVNARPVPPRSSDAYPWGNFKINNDSTACATENTPTATMDPDTDNEPPGTTLAATSSPVAHDPRSRTARNRICLMALSVGL